MREPTHMNHIGKNEQRRYVGEMDQHAFSHGVSRIEDKVMASVLAIHTGRKLVSGTALKAYAVVASLGAIVSFVSVENVLANLLNIRGAEGFIAFFESALTQTESIVQLALVLAAICGFLFARDLARSSSIHAFA